MKKPKIYNFLFWIIGIIFAEFWRKLLKNVQISEFFKWLMGIGIIIFVFFAMDKVEGLLRE